jgi:mRNA interferase RelE/StbE
VTTKPTKSRWTIEISRDAEKVMRRLPGNIARRIDARILALAENPRPEGCKKLEGHENLYRIRVGDWRISYALEKERLMILVIEVAPRGGAYQF